MSGIKESTGLPCEMRMEEGSGWMGEPIPSDSKMEPLWTPQMGLASSVVTPNSSQRP